MQMRLKTFSPGPLALLGAGFYLLLVLYLYHAIHAETGGHFTYALDDPYIHLALAENLAHGHYGINATEYSSPSSSILWPFLLLIGAGRAFHMYVPLAWNLLFGVLAAALLGRQVGRWPPQRDDSGGMAWWKQALTVILLVFAANLASLTMVGMEHVFQVLLAICCAIGVSDALSGRAIPAWCLAAAVLAPSVRYEDLSLTLAVALALAGLSQWKKAALVFGLSLAPVLGFSAYLKSKGLPALPMSVLVKGRVYGDASVSAKLIVQFVDSIHNDLIDPERFPVVVLFLLFAGLTWQARTRVERFVFGGAAILGMLQLLIGRFGWFYRYEDYALIFLLLVCLRVLAGQPRFLFGYFAMGLVFCASFYIKASATTTTGALEVYQQQYQMHRFVTEYYSGDYAVNDLGWTSFERRPGTYVLDVYGLASVEASSHPDKSAPWLAGIVGRYHVPLAILYPRWFHIPPSWSALAQMCNSSGVQVIAYQCVTFYSTEPGQEETIRAELQRFAPTLPTGIMLRMVRDGNDGSMREFPAGDPGTP